MTKLTRVEEEESDRDNPFRPGSQLDREADSILRGSHVSRNSIQLAGGPNDKPDSTLADSGVDGGADINNSVSGALTPTGDQVEQQPRRNSKGHVRINEDTVCIVSPDTQVTTAIIVDDEADEDAGEVQEAAPAPSPASKANGHSPLLPTDSSRRPGSQLDSSSLASPFAAPADMVEVQVCSATLNAAEPYIAEAVSVADAKKTHQSRKLAAKKQSKSSSTREDSSGAKKACCTVM
ncbi:hypothetical protein BOX15_Mlig000139g1 [Macrostomum lignano]|uniref:Uncharacterized protein n=2 Tax=Macrostomum lignano TaxID=282301 RepID=A0A267H964_9PLAT|nr:hypothetical protein BOX15_Mlig000139g1 [Macrostomum lignano]